MQKQYTIKCAFGGLNNYLVASGSEGDFFFLVLLFIFKKTPKYIFGIETQKNLK